MKQFEERLARLEKISDEIRTGELNLDESIKYFEEGMKLAKSLEKDLDRIERRVQQLVNNPLEEESEPNLELFPDIEAEDQ